MFLFTKQKKINDHILIKEIGRGSGGKVYLGKNEKTNQICAIKVISFKEMKTIKDIHSLNESISIIKTFHHPNIVEFKLNEKTKNNMYIITEYMNGGDLFQNLKVHKKKYGKPFSEVVVQKIIHQISPALEYLHSNNIVHRDIKIENLFINYNNKTIPTSNEFLSTFTHYYYDLEYEDFTIKIGDFDYAKELVGGLEATSFCGSPMSMAPDVLEESCKRKYNQSVDMWSLGILIYELVIGCPPFEGDNIEEIFEGIKKGKYIFPNNIEISFECINFINGLLRFDRNKRMKWYQIKEHPFYKGNASEFKKIVLESNTQEKFSKIEVNSKEDFMWLIYQNKCECGMPLQSNDTHVNLIPQTIKENYFIKHTKKSDNDNKPQKDILIKKAESEGWEFL